jgi:hypothetical protein
MMRILLITCFLVSYHLLGQDTPKVVVFENTSSQNTYDASAKENVLKWNMFGFTRGDFSLYYERKISDNVTGEIGFGVTKYDHYYHVFNESFGHIGYEPESGVFGYALSASIRLYADEAFDGFYFDLGLKHRVYNSDLTISSAYSIINFEDAVICKNAFFPRFTMGYFHQMNQFGIEPFVGVGLERLSAFPSNEIESEFDYARDVLRIHAGIKINLLF